MADFERLDDNSLKGALEALLLVSSEAVSAIDLAKTLGVAPGDAAAALADLAAEYADANRGIQLREVAGGWRFFTHPAYHDQVEKYVLSWDKTRLSQAALETLAVIAYHQPVSREGVRAVRGVNSDGVISSLVEKGLVREAGRDKDRGGAILYGTTARHDPSWSVSASSPCASCPTWRTSRPTRSPSSSSASASRARRSPRHWRRRTRTWRTSASFWVMTTTRTRPIRPPPPMPKVTTSPLPRPTPNE